MKDLVIFDVATKSSITTLLGLLRERESFVVTSHARPDGDAIGSALGLMHLLEAMGKQVTVAFSDPIPGIFHALPGVERVVAELPMISPDALVLLECDRYERTGFSPEAFDAMGPGFRINIDHHQSGRPFADFNWIDPAACAVGAMVYDLAVVSGMAISPAMATCLYAAVLTDTGSFTYSCTGADTFALAQHLVESGADSTGIAQAVYFSNSVGKMRLLGAALRNMKIDNGIAWTWTMQREMAEAGADVEDCEGVVNYLINIAGVEAAVFLRELPAGAQFRLSLRSRGGLDVARVAEGFGGGGHRNASGCTVDGPLDVAVGRVVTQLREAQNA